MDEADIWNELRKERQEKRWQNCDDSLDILKKCGIPYKTLNADVAHYRIDQVWDFWPTTGKFRNFKTGVTGRGVFNLIKKLTKKSLCQHQQ